MTEDTFPSMEPNPYPVNTCLPKDFDPDKVPRATCPFGCLTVAIYDYIRKSCDGLLHASLLLLYTLGHQIISFSIWQQTIIVLLFQNTLAYHEATWNSGTKLLLLTQTPKELPYWRVSSEGVLSSQLVSTSAR